MIAEILSDRINEVLDFTWRIQSCLETASYPMYESKEEMHSTMLRILQNDEDKILACYDQNALVGVLILLVEQENRYLQAYGIYAEADLASVYQEYLAYLSARYTGFKIDFGFPKENLCATAFLNDLGAECFDSCISLYLAAQDFQTQARVSCPSCQTYQQRKIEEVTSAFFEEFALFHDQHNADMYWTSARLRENTDKFKIFVIRESEYLVGCILYGIWNPDEAEIYRIAVDQSFNRSTLFAVLLKETLPQVFALGKQGILYMSDDDDAAGRDVALRSGFKAVGSYRGYRVLL